MNEKEALALLNQKAGFPLEVLPYFSDIFLHLTVLNPVRLETARRLGPILDLRPGQRVLDLACGKAGVSLPLTYTYKTKLVGVDLMPDFIREAWSRAEHAGLLEMVQFHLDDAAAFINTRPDTWDAILVIGALPFLWADLDQGMATLAARLNPGGRLVIGLPYIKPGVQQDPKQPQRAKDEITAWLTRTAPIVEIVDDGEEGWQAYVEPQKKAMASLRDYESRNKKLCDFLDSYTSELEWEAANLGFALWVLKI